MNLLASCTHIVKGLQQLGIALQVAKVRLQHKVQRLLNDQRVVYGTQSDSFVQVPARLITTSLTSIDNVIQDQQICL